MSIRTFSFQAITSQEAKELKAAFKNEFGITALARCNKKGSIRGSISFAVRALAESNSYESDTAAYSLFLAKRGYIAGPIMSDMLEAPYEYDKASTLWNWTSATVRKLAVN